MYTKDKNMGKAGQGVPGCIGGIRKYYSKKSEFYTVKNKLKQTQWNFGQKRKAVAILNRHFPKSAPRKNPSQLGAHKAFFGPRVPIMVHSCLLLWPSLRSGLSRHSCTIILVTLGTQIAIIPQGIH